MFRIRSQSQEIILSDYSEIIRLWFSIKLLSLRVIIRKWIIIKGHEFGTLAHRIKRRQYSLIVQLVSEESQSSGENDGLQTGPTIGPFFQRRTH